VALCPDCLGTNLKLSGLFLFIIIIIIIIIFSVEQWGICYTDLWIVVKLTEDWYLNADESTNLSCFWFGEKFSLLHDEVVSDAVKGLHARCEPFR